jgi:hypothetical protein
MVPAGLFEGAVIDAVADLLVLDLFECRHEFVPTERGGKLDNDVTIHVRSIVILIPNRDERGGFKDVSVIHGGSCLVRSFRLDKGEDNLRSFFALVAPGNWGSVRVVDLSQKIQNHNLLALRSFAENILLRGNPFAIGSKSLESIRDTIHVNAWPLISILGSDNFVSHFGQAFCLA